MQQKLIVISVDSLQTQDLKYLQTRPAFQKILSKCLLVKNIREIYPTLTYPIHTTIITGVTPDEHGIFHNQKPSIQPEKPDFSIMGSDWYWYSDYVKVDSIMDAANRAGLETASVMWPVMGGKKPKHNLAEIWPNQHEDMEITFKRACTEDIFDKYYKKYLVPFDWEKREDMDSYSCEVTLDIIKEYKPDLLLMHEINLDHIRHVYKNHGVMVRRCLDEVDQYIGRVLEACEEAGIADQTNIVILGDHGQIDVRHAFQLNILFRKYGLIRCDDAGNVESYDAYSFSAGFSTHIILKNPEDLEMTDKVYEILQEIQREYPEYVGRIFTKEEAIREEGLAGNFSFVVDSVEGILFANDLTGELIVTPDIHTKMLRAMHGHHPAKGPKPPFIVYGPAIQESKVIESGDMLDECPTLADLLGVDMPGLPGKSFL